LFTFAARVDYSLMKRLQNVPNFRDNAVMCVNLLVGADSSVEYTCTGEKGPAHDKVFTMSAKYRDQIYEATGKG
jgi:dsRNA-specific ribonuclease